MQTRLPGFARTGEIMRDSYTDMNSRKFPRTLESAFGPYTSRDVLEKSGGYHLHDKIVLWACAVAVVVVAALVIVGVVK